MTPEQQRISIAEACGWKSTLYQAVGKIGNVPFWYKNGKFCQESDLPDYLNDLNAMHEAEKVLLQLQRNYCHKVTPEFYYGAWRRYCDVVRQVTDARNNYGNHIHATAAQRAEAFLRTIGKWEDDK